MEMAALSSACYERITVTNYSPEPVAASISAAFAADYTDMFEARGMVRERRGRMLDPVADTPASVALGYEGLDGVTRRTAIAFDRAGGRLGQGGGYYDRTFAALPGAIRIGLAYAGQEADTLPTEPHDIRLHGVLTEMGYTPFA